MQTSPLDKIATGESNYEKYKDLFTDGRNDVVTMDSFYKLLVAEMSNQDPLEPTSNTEFISQLATFTSLQAQQDNFAMQKQNYANSLVGQTVSVQGKTKEDIVTGVVESVTYGDDIMVNVDGKSYKLSSIKQVYGNKGQPGGTDGAASQIGNYGAFAAGILGKTVMVQAKDANGDTVLDRGVVSSLEIQDGVVRVVVNGMAYDVTEVVQVTESVIPDQPEPDESDGGTSENAPSAGQTAAPGKTESAGSEKEPENIENAGTAKEPENTESAGALADRTDETDLKDIEESEPNPAETETPAQTAGDASWAQEPQQTWTQPLSESEKQDLRALFGTE